MADPVDEYRAAQEREYGQFVATERIKIGGALAFRPGDPVPASHVEREIVAQSQVARVNTKAAAAVTGQEG